MNTFTTFIHTIIALSTLSGVLIHDIHISKALKATQKKVSSSRYAQHKVRGDNSIAAEPHVHPERANKTLMHGFSYSTPSIAPDQRLKKYLKQRLGNGRHAFDNSTLPILS